MLIGFLVVLLVSCFCCRALLGISSTAVGQTQFHFCLRVLLFKGKGCLKRPDGLLIVTNPTINTAQHIVNLRIVWQEVSSLFVGFDRSSRIVLIGKSIT